MQTVEKRFVIEMTEKEISVAVDTLHKQYKTNKVELENMNRDGKFNSTLEMHNRQIKHLRNDLALLINRSFMGEDA